MAAFTMVDKKEKSQLLLALALNPRAGAMN
jgi:hypothetical protein